MATTTAKKKPLTGLTPRQVAGLAITKALVASVGYELLDQEDGKVSEQLVRRAYQIADEVIKQGGAS